MDDTPDPILDYAPPHRRRPPLSDLQLCIGLVGLVALLQYTLFHNNWFTRQLTNAYTREITALLVAAAPLLLFLAAIPFFRRRKSAYLAIGLLLIETQVYEMLIGIMISQLFGGPLQWDALFVMIRIKGIYILLGTLTALLLASLRKYPDTP